MQIPSSPRLRIFLPSLRTGVVIALTAVFLLGLGTFYFLQGKHVMDRMVRERLVNIAAIAAMEFSGEEMDRIRGRADMAKPLFRELVARLQRIQSAVPDIRYIYILRRTEDPFMLEFVVDADSLLTSVEADLNKNGSIDPDEVTSLPGDRYPIADVRVLQDEAFRQATTDDAVVFDQWGATFSGYAPIRTKDGRVVAVLGIDMTARDYRAFLQTVFSTQSFLLFLLGSLFVALFILVSFWRGRAEEMAHLNDERSWLMELVLHQVGTPLTIFKWGVESLEEICQRVSGSDLEEAKVNVELMKDGVSRLEHVTDVLLAADKVQRGRYAVHPEDVSLAEVVNFTVKAIEPQLARRLQTVRTEVAQNLHLSIDRKLLAGVLRELLDNAMIYSSKGGVITVRGRVHGGMAEVSIHDEGAGIPHGDLVRIFERFTRGSNAGHYDPNGTGIGLFIAKGIVERFGGRISAESGEGKGATITFSLPLR
ncbi:MAG: HAMP domain-containing sensor histidine kinase [Candidatus Peribacteraceae bacterium]|nr:HAMP domain-containing sensor histidine kinase [Candidatus Peribacteraceae bacterium]